MKPIHIIYTPNSDLFRFDNTEMYRSMYGLCENTREKLRVNCEHLRKTVPDLPETIGVVTYLQPIRDFFHESESLIKEFGSIDYFTTFLPLTILRTALKLEKEEIKDLVDAEYFYRNVKYLFCNPSILLDKTIPKNLEFLIPLMTTIAHAQISKRQIKELGEKSKVQLPHLNVSSVLEQAVQNIESFPMNRDKLKQIEEYYEERFRANQVSESLPLYFYPPNFKPTKYTVYLQKEPEIPKEIQDFLDMINSTIDDQPEAIQKMMRKCIKDRFAETVMFYPDFSIYLERLPEPKTIITDLYIVDAVPELQDLEIITTEFNFPILNSQPQHQN